MTIRETEPKFQLGSIKIGTKPGKEISQKGQIFVDVFPHEDPKIPFRTAIVETLFGEDMHPVSAFYKDQDTVLIKGAFRPMCEACKPQILERDQINSHPHVSKRIRWTAD